VPEKSNDLPQKVEVLDKVRQGMSYAAIGRFFGVNQSTERYIITNENAIRDDVMAGAPSTAKAARQVRDKALIKMENGPSLWIEDYNQKSIPINSTIIREKARSLYDHFKVAGGGEGTSGTRVQTQKGLVRLI